MEGRVSTAIKAISVINKNLCIASSHKKNSGESNEQLMVPAFFDYQDFSEKKM